MTGRVLFGAFSLFQSEDPELAWVAGPQHPSCLLCDVGMQESCQLPIHSAQGTSKLPEDRWEGRGLSGEVAGLSAVAHCKHAGDQLAP